MHHKTRDFPVGTETYQFRKLLPAVGTFIWQRLMAASYKAQATFGRGDRGEVEPPKDAPQPTPEDRLRVICGIAFMQLDFKDFEFIQNACMKATTRLVITGTERVPMPVMTDDAKWTADGAEPEGNPLLLTQLMVECLVHSLLPFLA